MRAVFGVRRLPAIAAAGRVGAPWGGIEKVAVWQKGIRERDRHFFESVIRALRRVVYGLQIAAGGVRLRHGMLPCGRSVG
jgi:hypothetical protein